ncbi:MAG: tRNA pseudouridine(55) synthase TruB [FCB group bacterium]|jgi:tRNA pseudouridine55 synthase|nr:tRNA pseudouridine(55) synthase TruB [FCB group bacterium]
MRGVLLVDKPSGMTSHDVVDRIRRAAGTRRVGHTGTLDPAATGLLILCLGEATRLSDFLTGLAKEYEGTLRFGLVTDSYDLDGKVVEERPVPDLSEAEIQKTFDQYTGDILQLPPMVSAVKINGERLYKAARRGEVVVREPRPVTVHEFSLLGYNAPDAQFRVRCTRGTYARTLCYDVGEALGCGGTLAALRRTAVGAHRVENAAPVDAFVSLEDVASRLLRPEDALDLPAIVVKAASRRTVVDGGTLDQNDWIGRLPVEQGWLQVKTETGALLAVGEVRPTPHGLTVQPRRVIAGPR